MKFGVKSHVDLCCADELPEKYVLGLLGRINYVLSIEPKNEQMQKYKIWLQNKMQNGELLW